MFKNKYSNFLTIFLVIIIIVILIVASVVIVKAIQNNQDEKEKKKILATLEDGSQEDNNDENNQTDDENNSTIEDLDSLKNTSFSNSSLTSLLRKDLDNSSFNFTNGQVSILSTSPITIINCSSLVATTVITNQPCT